MSSLVVFTSPGILCLINLPFLSSLLCPLSLSLHLLPHLHHRSPSPRLCYLPLFQFPLLMRALPLTLLLLHYHLHHILLLHHLHQYPPMSPSHRSHPQALPVPLLPGPTIWSPEYRITPDTKGLTSHPVSHAFLSHDRLGHHSCWTQMFHASF